MAKKIIEGAITSPFGVRKDPLDGFVRIHQGVDISAPVGTPVHAPCYAVVVAVFDHSLGGKTLILRGRNDEVRYGFCHLSSVDVAVGGVVAKGRVVARSGNTGRTTGPHLHFSVKRGGVWYDSVYEGGAFVDPVPYIEIK